MSECDTTKPPLRLAMRAVHAWAVSDYDTARACYDQAETSSNTWEFVSALLFLCGRGFRLNEFDALQAFVDVMNTLPTTED